jgi:membrane-bound acyltransferase YfiQ involved in biofilm formation
MGVSQHYNRMRSWHWPLLMISILAVVFTALAQTYVWVHLGNYHKAALSYEGLDLQFVQVMFACSALLLLCYHLHWRWLQRHLIWLAELSFPIFFIHPLLTIALENLLQAEGYESLFPAASMQLSLVIFAVTFMVQFYGSVAIALLIRTIAKRRSAFIIG